MKEFADSISDVMRSRLSNSLYGTFFLSWCIFHWNFIYSLIALSQESVLSATGLMKNEYLLLRYFNWHELPFWILFAVPFIMTYLVINVFPNWFLISAYKKDQEYNTGKKLIDMDQLIEIEKRQVKQEKLIAESAQAKVRQQEAEVRIEEISPEVKWRKEFDDFMNTRVYKKFGYLIQAIYEHNGYIEIMDHKIPTEVVVYADTNDLITFKGNNQVQLTDKGKYYVKRYNESLDLI